MISKPTCKCHKTEMAWRKDRRNSKGGHWYCVIKKRATWLRYENKTHIHRMLRQTERRLAKYKKQGIEV